MDIYLSINNREQVIRLPVVPKEIKIQSDMDNTTFNTITLGDIKLIGLPALKTVSIQSFFPQQEYSFTRDKTYKGWEYVEIIVAWKARREPIRLIITETPINMACTIESFEYGPQDGTGDVYYTLSLSEFKFVQLEQRSV
ncbi:hypothetical protein BR63_19220 [Thermanaerosceptrum fracticalcis]|uniref:Phage portal protein n=1 Tax=Thermanaerosceptrum fracticalcis TaxID=1712410 RepID=A0A7G6E809_THEFR|nr:hypothetical protein [Thermanaerosceptrum fracticalcis]QNB48213.1 hypothetical protein BR63_19220 [Thermanaerosceptrum fracticalcis]